MGAEDTASNFKESAFPTYLQHAAANATVSDLPSQFGKSLHTYQASSPFLDAPPPLQRSHRDFAKTSFSADASSSSAQVSSSHSAASLSLAAKELAASVNSSSKRSQPALSRFTGTPQRTFSFPSSALPSFSESSATDIIPFPSSSVSSSVTSESHASFTDESFAHSQLDVSTNSTPNSLFKSPSQIPLAPHVSQTSHRQSDTDSAAARFVSSLSESHLQSMLSDLLVEKNALLKVITTHTALFSFSFSFLLSF